LGGGREVESWYQYLQVKLVV
jgi:hypothetical protein